LLGAFKAFKIASEADAVELFPVIDPFSILVTVVVFVLSVVTVRVSKTLFTNVVICAPATGTHDVEVTLVVKVLQVRYVLVTSPV
jgi:hypothetical protein